MKIKKIYCRQTYGDKVALTKDEEQENKCLRKESKKKDARKKVQEGEKISDYLMFTCSALTEDGFSS